MGTKISDVMPLPGKVSTGNGEFEVHGLPLPAVVRLIQQYRANFARLLVLGSNGQPDYSEILSVAPEMVTDIILLASRNEGDDEQREAARLLPSGVQLLALETIWKMSVVDSKKLQALLSVAMAELRKHAPVFAKTLKAGGTGPGTETPPK